MLMVLKPHFSIHPTDTRVPHPVADALLFPVPLQPAERLPQGAARLLLPTLSPRLPG